MSITLGILKQGCCMNLQVVPMMALAPTSHARYGCSAHRPSGTARPPGTEKEKIEARRSYLSE